ncbi:MAG: hypothetical protein NTY61_02280 [Candidatus Parcubacteria bacterium]|nr:hypothetical protein [Candidatus Parcubacteria bacterium]
MPLYDESGQEIVGALTPEEVDAKLDEIRVEVAQAKDDEIYTIKEALDAKEAEIVEARELLEAEKNKDKNLSGQRNIIKEREAKIVELEKSLSEFKILLRIIQAVR